MIVEREREIEAFVPVEYWEVYVKGTRRYKNVQSASWRSTRKAIFVVKVG